MYMSEYIGVLVVYIKEHMLLDVKSFISQDSTVFKLTAFVQRIYANLLTKIILYLPVYIMFGYTKYEI